MEFHSKMKKKKVLVLPNVLTILRIALSPVFFVLLLNNMIVPGLIIFIIVALTDGIDGMLARIRKEKTKFGEFLDPMADKIMIALAVIVLILRFEFPTYGLWILSRDFVSLGASFLMFKKGKARWEASPLGKTTTLLQTFTVIAFIVGHILREVLLFATMLISTLTAITYFVRGRKIAVSK
jgi:CDP-diacylglycerol--glycerol-3-phosphate 3-phosphatidyltransferase